MKLLLVTLVMAFVFVVVSSSLANAKSQVPYPFAVVMQGSPALLGQRISGLAVYSFDGVKWRKIRHQIDERNRRGDYVLAHGLPFTSHTGDGLFDSNDELVLWGPDFGKAFTKAQIDKSLKKIGSRFWRVVLKSDLGKHGEVLVVRSDATHSDRRPESMIQLDARKGIVESKEYYYQFRDTKAALIGDLAFKDQGKKISVIKESHFIMNFELPWYLPDFSLTDSNFYSEIESWQVGPIRAIVAVGVKFRNFLSLFNFHMFSELVFYENSFRIPTIVEFPVDPSRHFKLGTGIAYALKFSDELPLSFNSNLTSLPKSGAENYIKSGKEMADAFPYFFIDGDFGKRSLLMKVEVDRRAARTSMPPFLIRQSMFGVQDMTDQWPWIDGLSGDVGAFIDISRVHKGSYDFGLDIFLSPEANEKVISGVDSLRASWLDTSFQ